MNKILCGVCFFFILLTYSCASIELTNIKREPLKDINSIVGNFTVILYGGGHHLETLTVLDAEDDEFKFEPYAPEYNYIVKTHLTGEEALKVARRFLGHKPIKIRAITNKQGNILGYELKRRYWYLKYGTSDVLDVNYSLKKDKIFIYIRVKPFVENMLQGN
jgi:hypothetical protein